MWRCSLGTIAVLAATVAPASAAGPAGPPIAVSPGDGYEIVTVAHSCPTFSWTEVSGAGSYELAVYDVTDPTAEAGGEGSSARATPAFVDVILPAAASSWTPSSARCLETGHTYAWSIRAYSIEGEPSGWSQAKLFEVDETLRALPLRDELVEELERYVEERIRVLVDASSAALAADRFGPAGTRRGAGRSVGPKAPTGEAAELVLTGVAALRADQSDATGETYGVRGTSTSSDTLSAGVAGEAGATTGLVAGVYGITPSNQGVGVFGETTSVEGEIAGVYGQTGSPDGTGVFGLAYATDGSATGVSGQTDSPIGMGVRGEAKATTAAPEPGDFAIGVGGSSDSPTGIGVLGEAQAASGLALGVVGYSNSPGGIGGIFINEGGGLLLAANDASAPDNLEFAVDAAGTVLLLPTDSPTACSGSLTGAIYFDASLNELCFCNGASWQQVDGGGAC